VSAIKAKRGPEPGDVRVTNNSDRSDTATYALRRLKRDNPELAEKVVAGVLSAHAAAAADLCRPCVDRRRFPSIC
jgi:hypothetical protein